MPCKPGVMSSIPGFSSPSDENYQRTNGPVNAHLISWPSKAQNNKPGKYMVKK